MGMNYALRILFLDPVNDALCFSAAAHEVRHKVRMIYVYNGNNADSVR